MSSKRKAKNAQRVVHVNSSDPEADRIRGRMSRFLSGTYDGADTMHNIYSDFGYPLELKFSDYWNMYRRFGIASNVADLPVDTCWTTVPTIEGSDAISSEIDRLNKRVKFWSRLKALDSRQRIGRYAGLFMRVKDNQTPDKPIGGKLPGSGALVQMIPLYEGQLKVLEVNTDPLDDKFGLPKMYQFDGGDAGNVNDKAMGSFNIHPDRLIIAAEGADNGDIYGRSCIESCFNSLMDLRKIIGGGGEGFYRNAAQSIVFNLQDPKQAQQNAALLTDLSEQYDDFSKNRNRRAMWTPGLEAKTLESTLIASDTFFNNALNDVAAASKIPATILIGKQTGRLASNEDARAFLSMLNSRRSNFINSMIMDVINWMILRGILPAGEVELEWDDLLAPSAQEKLDNTDKMASVNQKQFQSGGQPVFSADEMREAAGYEVEDLPEPDEDLPEDESDGEE